MTIKTKAIKYENSLWIKRDANFWINILFVFLGGIGIGFWAGGLF